VTAAPDGAGDRSRVLIVEDHELLATSLALALRQQGLVVETVDGSGRAEIVAIVRRLAPVLVLLDLDLGPGMGSGVDLVRPLIQAGGRVVMVTGVADRARLAACVEVGATGIVSKTAGFDVLVDAVRRAVDGEELFTDYQRQELLADLRVARQADRERSAPFERLSPREQAVLAGLVAGETAEAIAADSYVSLATVRSQIRAILLKLGVTSQLAAVARARAAGWPPPPD
jgi:DNA-binding NarL/FixJ family response regulator